MRILGLMKYLTLAYLSSFCFLDLYIGQGNPVPTNGSTHHLYIGQGNPVPTNGSTHHLYIGQGNPVPTNGSTHHLSIDRILDRNPLLSGHDYQFLRLKLYSIIVTEY